MKETSLQWICEALSIKLKASRILRLLWVDGYGSQAVAREMGMTQPAVTMCSGRHLRKAEMRARKAQEAAVQVREFRQQQAALIVKEAKGEADETDRERVRSLEAECTEDVRLLAMEAILWQQHFLDEPLPDYEADPGALPPPLPLNEHARELRHSMRGPRKKTPQTPEYDANGRRVGAPATIVTNWETERLCEQVAARRGITRDPELLNPPL